MVTFCEVSLVLDNIEGCRQEFRRYENVSPKDFGTIEYLVRKGRKSFEMYSQLGIKAIQL